MSDYNDLLIAAVEACNLAFETRTAGDKFAVYYTDDMKRDVLAMLAAQGVTFDAAAKVGMKIYNANCARDARVKLEKAIAAAATFTVGDTFKNLRMSGKTYRTATVNSIDTKTGRVSLGLTCGANGYLGTVGASWLRDTVDSENADEAVKAAHAAASLATVDPAHIVGPGYKTFAAFKKALAAPYARVRIVGCYGDVNAPIGSYDLASDLDVSKPYGWTISGCTATRTRMTQARIGIGTAASDKTYASVTYIIEPEERLAA
jgi:hypothetical protein